MLTSDSTSLLIADHVPVRLTAMLWNPLEHCYACSADPVVRWSLPIDYNGDVVERDYGGPWMLVPSCAACYRAYAEAGVAGLDIRTRTLEATRAAPAMPNIVIDLDLLRNRTAPIIGEAR
jgi:hypothetical protein